MKFLMEKWMQKIISRTRIELMALGPREFPPDPLHQPGRCINCEVRGGHGVSSSWAFGVCLRIWATLRAI